MKKFYVIMLFLLVASGAYAWIRPTVIKDTLCPGDSTIRLDTVGVPTKFPKADVIFSVDLTGSMSEELNQVKTSAIDIMNSLDAMISDAQYGVVSYMDYPGYFSWCGYANTYGDASSGDYAYKLNQPLTTDKPAVSNAINALSLGYGVDGPESYVRVLYESYADTGIHWRELSKRIWINFDDNVPHDCNLEEGISGGSWTTGIDPGRDATAGTGDDLDLLNVLYAMADSNVTLLDVHSGSYLSYWDYWAGLTGGAVFQLSAANQIPAAVDSLMGEEVTQLDTLRLKVTTSGFEGWLAYVSPAYYADISLTAPEDTFLFDIIIKVPTGTPELTTYTFNISAIGDAVSYGEQVVEIYVPDCPEYVEGDDSSRASLRLNVSPTIFSNEVVLRYHLPVGDKVSLKVYNLAGELVAEVINESQPAGDYTVKWAPNLAPGIYFVRLSVGSSKVTQKILCVKSR